MEKEVTSRRHLLQGSLIFLAGAGILSIFRERWNNQKIQEYASMTLEEARHHVNTLEETTRYCENYLMFYPSSFVKSPKRIHEERKADCKEQSLMAWYLNSDNGYKPTFLIMYSHGSGGRNDPTSHLVFYQEVNYVRGNQSLSGYNVVSEGMGDVYPSLESITKAYARKGYRRVTFDARFIPDWTTTNEDLSLAFKSVDKDITWVR